MTSGETFIIKTDPDPFTSLVVEDTIATAQCCFTPRGMLRVPSSGTKTG